MIIYQRVKNKLSIIVSTMINFNFWGIPVAIRYTNFEPSLNIRFVQLWFLCFGIEFEWFVMEKRIKL